MTVYIAAKVNTGKVLPMSCCLLSWAQLFEANQSSKLLVNKTLQFQAYYMLKSYHFLAEKMGRAFAVKKLLTFFFAKNISTVNFVSTLTLLD